MKEHALSRHAAKARAAVQVASGQPITALWQGYADPMAWGAILWASLGPGALAAFLQTQVRLRSQCDHARAFRRSSFIAGCFAIRWTSPGRGAF